MHVLLTSGRHFSVNFKNGNQHTGVVALVDSQVPSHSTRTARGMASKWSNVRGTQIVIDFILFFFVN